MKRIEYSKYGRPEELRLADVDRPKPGQGQILVQVKAASVNPMDWKIRRGEMKVMTGSRFPRGLGHDFSGVVDAVGPNVERLKVGDAVFGAANIRQAGAFAEYVVADEEKVALKPTNVTFEQAAAMTVAGSAAWIGLMEKAKLTTGQSVLITGCLGNVGRLAVQIALMQDATLPAVVVHPGARKRKRWASARLSTIAPSTLGHIRASSTLFSIRPERCLCASAGQC